MKKLLLTIPALALYVAAQAQNVGIGTTSPDASAMLEIRSTNKGLLIPRVALTGINDATTIPTPATGLMVYSTSAALPSGTGFYVNTGTTTAPMWAKMPTIYSSDAPVAGQSLIWNGTTYAPAFGTISSNGTYFSGNGTPSSPLNFNGIATGSTVLSGNGTTASPLNVNTASPVYNANQISSKPVSTTAPTNAQVLVYDAANNQYKPAPVNAVQIQGNSVSSTAPTNAQVLVWDAATSTYKPAPVNAVQIQGNSVSSTAPTNAQVLIWDATTNTYKPAPVNAVQIQGNSVSNTAPTANQVLIWDATTNSYKPAPVNAVQIQNKNVSSTAPTGGQVLVFNSVTNQWEPYSFTDSWGNQVVVTAPGSVLTGNGTTASPLNVTTTTPVYNANKLYNSNVSSTAPTANQVLAWDATTSQYVPAPVNAVQIQSKSVSSVAPTANQVLVWDATTNQYKPAPVNAAQIQNVDVSSTAPTSNQTLVYNSTTNKWEPKTVVLTDTWGSQTIVNAPNSVLSGNGTTASPLNVNTGANVYNANKINNITVTGTPTDGQTLVYDATSNTYQTADLSFNYSKSSTSGFSISQAAETGATPYTQNSLPGATIQPGSGSWTAIPGLTKTFTVSSPTNSVGFMTQGVVEYNGTLSSSGWVSYSIAIFVDGKLQATRIFTMTGSGGVDQFDTYQVSGQIENMTTGSHTIAVYGTRRNSPNNSGSNQDLYFCSPAPNYPNTNDFMNRGVLFINGSY